MLSSADALGALVALQENRGKAYYLFEERSFIGRCEDSVICLKDPRISRQHCVISKSPENTFIICDLSIHGTFVNNKPLVRMHPQKLEDKDIISFPPVACTSYMLKVNTCVMDGYPSKQRDEIRARLDMERLSLQNSQCEEMIKLAGEIIQTGTKKTDLKEEMIAKLKAQENLFDDERKHLTGLVSTTEELKEEAEKKLIEMESKHKEEREKLTREIECKIEECTKKEEELEKLKREMESRHYEEHMKLEERYKLEVKELKAKLGVSELEQNRLQGEAQEARQKLAETNMTLVDSRLEQSRLSHEVIDLTRESTSKDEIVLRLEQKLKEQEAAAEKWKKEMEGLEEHLQCSICVELFIDPALLNCGHMFCLVCIEEWKSKKKVCPMCREKITNTMRIFNLDTIIDKHIALLPLEARERRESVIKQRIAKKAAQTPAKKRKCNHQRFHVEDEPNTMPHPRLRVYVTPPGSEPRNEVDPIDLRNIMTLPFIGFPELGDPFGFRERAHHRAPAPETHSSDFAVSVAAIDLTNLPPVISTSSIGQRTRSASASNTSVVDLTSP